MRKFQRVVHALESFDRWAQSSGETVKPSRVDLDKVEADLKRVNQDGAPRLHRRHNQRRESGESFLARLG